MPDTITSEISPQTTVGSLVAERPARAAVFNQYGIDYCCGGKRPLEEVCREKGISLVDIMTQLAAVNSDPPVAEDDWNKVTLRQLIEHIVTCYHEPLRKQAPEVLRLAQKVAKVHGDNHPEMIQVAQIFGAFKQNLELHMEKEEVVLFPGIAKMEQEKVAQMFGCGGGIEHPIAMMTAEHDEAGEALKKLRDLTNGFTPPPDACNSFRVLLHSLSEIESEMHQHVHKENNILFPRALNLACATVRK